MSRLVKQGLIRAVRGQKGGFVLARSPRDITLINVLEALEGPLQIVESIPFDSPAIEFAAQAEAKLRHVFDIPLLDILARHEGRAVMFHI